VDDVTFGRALRAIRHRRRWTQAEVATKAGIDQAVVSRVERGQIEGLSVRSLRAICSTLEVRLLFTASWRGGELDRLLDEDHAAVTARNAELLRRTGWLPYVEVTFSQYGERGSIDVLGLKPAERAAVINECKTDLTSTEQLNRGVDRKARLAADLIAQRFGWRPLVVGRLVVFADTSTNRRRVAAQPVLDTAYPARGRAVREWLQAPSGPIAGLVFVSVMTGGSGRRAMLGRKRIRKPKSCVATRVGRPDSGGGAA